MSDHTVSTVQESHVTEVFVRQAAIIALMFKCVYGRSGDHVDHAHDPKGKQKS